MNPIRTTYAGVKPAASENTMLHVPNGAIEMQLLHEALSRARMPRPQAGRSTTSTEATRSARTVAMNSRNQAARDLGVL
ncbi:hypothetical protein ACFOOK_09460 [Micromonospora krabiensis]|uniref:Uncharacterized protein n=1 Tax=Micromonospora krabiensis TaxID=307121 RepID=A0A1C3NB47_9ACTN|nr:hypothetical protein [Micromonospora krabiensis]SBV29778.1 hypothetical protein GA0070620_5359 [Micromonospora krabiensis]